MARIPRKFVIADVTQPEQRATFFAQLNKLLDSGAFGGSCEITLKLKVQRDELRATKPEDAGEPAAAAST